VHRGREKHVRKGKRRLRRNNLFNFILKIFSPTFDQTKVQNRDGRSGKENQKEISNLRREA